MGTKHSDETRAKIKEAVRKRFENDTPEKKAARQETGRKVAARMTPEQRAVRDKQLMKSHVDANALLTAEDRTQIALKRWANMTEEQKATRSEKIRNSASHETRSERVKKVHARKSTTERSETAAKAHATRKANLTAKGIEPAKYKRKPRPKRSAEQRSASAKQGVETRRLDKIKRLAEQQSKISPE